MTNQIDSLPTVSQCGLTITCYGHKCNGNEPKDKVQQKLLIPQNLTIKFYSRDNKGLSEKESRNIWSSLAKNNGQEPKDFPACATYTNEDTHVTNYRLELPNFQDSENDDPNVEEEFWQAGVYLNTEPKDKWPDYIDIQNNDEYIQQAENSTLNLQFVLEKISGKLQNGDHCIVHLLLRKKSSDGYQNLWKWQPRLPNSELNGKKWTNIMKKSLQVCSLKDAIKFMSDPQNYESLQEYCVTPKEQEALKEEMNVLKTKKQRKRKEHKPYQGPEIKLFDNKEEVAGNLSHAMNKVELNKVEAHNFSQVNQNLDEQLNIKDQGLKINSSVDQEVIRKASGGTILQGILIDPYNIHECFKDRDQIIEVPQQAEINNADRQNSDFYQYAYSQSEHDWQSKVATKSSSEVSAGGGGSFFGVSLSASVGYSQDNEKNEQQQKQSAKSYMSKTKYYRYYKGLFKIQPEEVKLSKNALIVLKNIDIKNDYNASIQAKEFLQRFGSDIKLGPFYLGGIRNVIATVQYDSSMDQDEVAEGVSSKLEAKLEVSSPFAKVEAKASDSDTKTSSLSTTAKKVSNNTNVTKQFYGGPLTEDDTVWVQGLREDKSTWAVIDQGQSISLKVWQAIKLNHVNDFEGEHREQLVNILAKQYYQMITRNKGESDEDFIIEQCKTLLQPSTDENSFCQGAIKILEQISELRQKYLLGAVDFEIKFLHFISLDVIKAFFVKLSNIQNNLEDMSAQQKRVNTFFREFPASYSIKEQVQIRNWFKKKQNDTSKEDDLQDISLRDLIDQTNVLYEKMKDLEKTKVKDDCFSSDCLEERRLLQSKVLYIFYKYLGQIQVNSTQNIQPKVELINAYFEWLCSQYLNYNTQTQTFQYSILSTSLNTFMEQIKFAIFKVNNIAERCAKYDRDGNQLFKIQSHSFSLSLIIDNLGKDSKDEFEEALLFFTQTYGLFTDAPFQLSSEMLDNVSIAIQIQRIYQAKTLKEAQKEIKSIKAIINNEDQQQNQVWQFCLDESDSINIIKEQNTVLENKLELQKFQQKALEYCQVNELINKRSMCKIRSIQPTREIEANENLPLNLLYQIYMINPDAFKIRKRLPKTQSIEKQSNQKKKTKKRGRFDSSSDEDSQEDAQSNKLLPENVKMDHVQDVLVQVLLASNHMVRETAIQNMDKIKQALPLILPSKQMIMWPYLSLQKSWKVTGDQQCKELVIHHRNPIISFIRLGTTKSKSDLLNKTLFRDIGDNVFVSRMITEPQKARSVSKGLIEMSWYQPESKIGQDSKFKDLLTILNLRGDALELPEQLAFLKEHSDMLVVLTDSLECIQMANFDKNQDPCAIVLAPSKFKGVRKLLQAKQLQLGEITNDFVEQFEDTICDILWSSDQESEPFDFKKTCLNDISKKLKGNFNCDLQDEILSETKQEADAIIDLFRQENGQFKDKFMILPLQRPEIQGEYVSNHKKITRVTSNSQALTGSIQQRIKILRERNQGLRKEQKRLASQQCTEIKSFIKKLYQQCNKSIEHGLYFIEWITLELNKESKRVIEGIRKEYIAQLKDYETSKSKKQLEEAEFKKMEVQRLGTEMNTKSFGIEHLMREISLIYDCNTDNEFQTDAQNSKQSEDSIEKLPELVAKLLLNGFSIEAMDGDNAYIQSNWIQAIMNHLDKLTQSENQRKKVYVNAIIGTQSTGKSTMLNAQYNFKFAVAAARCTKGIFMQLVEIDQTVRDQGTTDAHYIMIMDTEGLRAPELTSNSVKNITHDNEMATTIMGIADLTFMNVMKLASPSMNEILEIVIHAFLRLKQNNTKIDTKMINIHQDVSNQGNPRAENANAKQKIMAKLDEITKSACIIAGYDPKDVLQFNELIPDEPEEFIDPLFKGNPDRDPFMLDYVTSVQRLKQKVVRLSNQNAHTFCQISDRIINIWNGVLHENFTFQFINNMQMSANAEVEKQYSTHALQIISEVNDFVSRMKALEQQPTFNKQKFESEKNKEEIKILNHHQKTFKEWIKKQSVSNEYIAGCEHDYLEFLSLKVKSTLKNDCLPIESLLVTRDFKNQCQQKAEAVEKEIIDKANKLFQGIKKTDKAQVDKKFEEFWKESTRELVAEKIDQNYYIRPIDDAITQLRDRYKTKLQIEVNELVVKGWPTKYKHKSIDQKNYQQYCSNRSAGKWFKDTFTLKSKSEQVIKSAMEDRKKIDKQVAQDLLKTYETKIHASALDKIDKQIAEAKTVKELPFTQTYNLMMQAYYLEQVAPQQSNKLKNELEDMDPSKTLENDLKPQLKIMFHAMAEGLSQVETSSQLTISAFKNMVKNTVNHYKNDKLMLTVANEKPQFLLSKKFMYAHIMKRIVEEEDDKKAYEDLQSFISEYEDVALQMIRQYVTSLDKDKTLKNLIDARNNQIEGYIRQISEYIEADTLEHWPDNIINDQSASQYPMIWSNCGFSSDKLQCKQINKKTMLEFKNQLLKDWQNDQIKAQDVAFTRTDLEKVVQKYSDDLGCMAQCPYCRVNCENGKHGKETKHHCGYHRHMGLKGTAIKDTRQGANSKSCEEMISENWRMYQGDSFYEMKDYQKKHPNWHIGDAPASREQQKFWQYCEHRFTNLHLKKHNLDSWAETPPAITASDALQSIEQFRKKA